MQTPKLEHINGTPHQHFVFGSWSEFVDHAMNAKTTMRQESRHSRWSRGHSWDLGANWETTCQLAQTGWLEGAKMIDAKLSILSNVMPSYEREYTLAASPMGPGFLDMGAYNIGYPEPYNIWVETESTRESSHGGIVVINYNATASRGVSAERLVAKGAVICALVKQLESAGRSVEVNVIFWSRRSFRGSVRVDVKVKRAGETLTLERMAFAIAHPVTFRRLGFSVCETADPKIRKGLGINMRGNYGSCHDIADSGENVININSQDLNKFDHAGDNWQEWIQQELARQGINWEC